MNENPLSSNILSARIAALRKEAGLTQEQLAARLGLSYQAVSKWENSQSCPDIMLLPTLADIFNVSIDSLFGRGTDLPPVPLPAEPSVPELELPWPDDGGLYAVLFRGHSPVTGIDAARDMRFTYSGPALNVSSQFDVYCEGCDIAGDVNAGGDLTCENVGGSVSAGGDVTCGDVGGDLSASGDASCYGVGGSVSAGGDVDCGDVSGSVEAGGDIDCGSVGGNVAAQGDIDCGSVGGNVAAQGDIDCGSVQGSVAAEGDVDFSARSGRKTRQGRIVVNGQNVGDYSFTSDGDFDLSRLGETIRRSVNESLKSVKEALKSTFDEKDK